MFSSCMASRFVVSFIRCCRLFASHAVCRFVSDCTDRTRRDKPQAARLGVITRVAGPPAGQAGGKRRLYETQSRSKARQLRMRKQAASDMHLSVFGAAGARRDALGGIEQFG